MHMASMWLGETFGVMRGGGRCSHPGKYYQTCVQTSWHAPMKHIQLHGGAEYFSTPNHTPALGQSQHCFSRVLHTPGSCIPRAVLLLAHIPLSSSSALPNSDPAHMAPSRESTIPWCTSQTQTCLGISVYVQGAFSTLHLLLAAGTEGHRHRQDVVASVAPVHGQKQLARPGEKRENIPLVVGALGNAL